MNEKYMKFAFKEAQKAYKKGEIPVGAIIVKNGKIIGKGYNKKEKAKNAIMHAEIIAINKACKKSNDWRLNDCEMYVTLEPCLMCIGAIKEARIKKIYCGVKNSKSNEYNQWVCNCENIKIEYGILENDISLKMKKFFKKIRK